MAPFSSAQGLKIFRCAHGLSSLVLLIMPLPPRRLPPHPFGSDHTVKLSTKRMQKIRLRWPVSSPVLLSAGAGREASGPEPVKGQADFSRSRAVRLGSGAGRPPSRTCGID